MIKLKQQTSLLLHCYFSLPLVPDPVLRVMPRGSIPYYDRQVALIFMGEAVIDWIQND